MIKLQNFRGCTVMVKFERFTVTDGKAQVSFGRHLCCYSIGRTDRGRGQPRGCRTYGTRIWPARSHHLPEFNAYFLCKHNVFLCLLLS